MFFICLSNREPYSLTTSRVKRAASDFTIFNALEDVLITLILEHPEDPAQELRDAVKEAARLDGGTFPGDPVLVHLGHSLFDNGVGVLVNRSPLRQRNIDCLRLVEVGVLLAGDLGVGRGLRQNAPLGGAQNTLVPQNVDGFMVQCGDKIPDHLFNGGTGAYIARRQLDDVFNPGLCLYGVRIATEHISGLIRDERVIFEPYTGRDAVDALLQLIEDFLHRRLVLGGVFPRVRRKVPHLADGLGPCRTHPGVIIHRDFLGRIPLVALGFVQSKLLRRHLPYIFRGVEKLLLEIGKLFSCCCGAKLHAERRHFLVGLCWRGFFFENARLFDGEFDLARVFIDGSVYIRLGFARVFVDNGLCRDGSLASGTRKEVVKLLEDGLLLCDISVNGGLIECLRNTLRRSAGLDRFGAAKLGDGVAIGSDAVALALDGFDVCKRLVVDFDREDTRGLDGLRKCDLRARPFLIQPYCLGGRIGLGEPPEGVSCGGLDLVDAVAFGCFFRDRDGAFDVVVAEVFGDAGDFALLGHASVLLTLAREVLLKLASPCKLPSCGKLDHTLKE